MLQPERAIIFLTSKAFGEEATAGQAARPAVEAAAAALSSPR